MNGALKLYRAGSIVYTKRALALLCLWLLWGDFCYILMETVVPSIMPLKFKALGASNALMGLLVTNGAIPGLIDTVMSPIISFKSDRFRSRWGRRIPFVAATLPFLVACLLGLAYGDQLAFGLRERFAGALGGFAPGTVAIAVLGAMMVLFSFFNTFVNSVFWYLFNDVVPEELLARFVSWFRVVGLAAGAVYNLFVFKHAGTHASEILSGAALLYLVGFGLMCLKVKEGKYPPPPPYVGGQVGVLAAMRTYFRECLSLPHYWFVFIAAMGMMMARSAAIFSIFFYQTVGLTFEQIGRIAFTLSLVSAIAIPISGWLADRFHPMRVVVVGIALQLCIAPFNLVWLFWHAQPDTVFHVILAAQICLFAPVAALVTVMDPPLFMRIFPRERYGQFCSANAMLRSIAAMIASVLLGAALDAVAVRWGQSVAYRCLPLWNTFAYAIAFGAVLKLYRSWLRHGGDAAYIPPLPGEPPSMPAPPAAAVARPIES